MFKKLFLTPLLFLGLLSTITSVSSASEPLKTELVEFVAKPGCSELGSRLVGLPETEEGIRLRMALITEELNANPELYHLGNLPLVDDNLIALRFINSRTAAGGIQPERSSKGRTVRYTMSINLASNDHQSNERNAEMHLVDTIVHELAHCYFLMRYAHLQYNETADHIIIEGFAMHVARTFLQHHFPDYSSSSSKIYGDNYVSDTYAIEYRKFVNKYTDDMGNIDWDSIDQRELSRAPYGYVIRNFTQGNAERYR